MQVVIGDIKTLDMPPIDHGEYQAGERRQGELSLTHYDDGPVSGRVDLGLIMAISLLVSLRPQPVDFQLDFFRCDLE